MIDQTYSDEVLRSARRTCLFDPADPSFQSLKSDRIPGGVFTSQVFIVVDVPVALRNADAVEFWRARIQGTR